MSDFSIEHLISPAQAADLPDLVAILADDDLGGHADAWTPTSAEAYLRAFHGIAAEPNAALLVARDAGGRPLGFMHMTWVHSLPDSGAMVATLHSLFVAARARGCGAGAALLCAAERLAAGKGASFMTLVSNKKREDAHRFYRSHGYEQRHEGFKKRLGAE